jgi:hypothetical protein
MGSRLYIGHLTRSIAAAAFKKQCQCLDVTPSASHLFFRIEALQVKLQSGKGVSL